jgi:7,8-dihydropterin-6-yl-methyl-4-(beta-D-ribofuranosyl)aminobenzene 5'-phosphate synthase
VYDNVAQEPGFTTGWGFACLIRGLPKTVLFDTGADGEVLLSNLNRIGVAPSQIDAVVLSHPHRDHTGGLRALLTRNGNLTVYVLSSFPASLLRMARKHGARVVVVSGPRELVPGIHSTGPLGVRPKEQTLVVQSARGAVVVTGCAHPTIERVVREVRNRHGGPIALLLGGLHLLKADRARLDRVVAALQTAAVQQVAPSHCTGKAATERLHVEWGERFVPSGCGAHFSLPLRAQAR